MNNKSDIFDYIGKIGLMDFFKMTGIRYHKILTAGKKDVLTRKVKQKFIEDIMSQTGYGFGLSEIDEDPIYYQSNNDEYKEITYLGLSSVVVEVWSRDTEEVLGEYRVSYSSLHDKLIDKVFDSVIIMYENDLDLQK